MCTAYEIGKRGGSFPEWLIAEAGEYLLGLNAVRIVRPTHKAPVIMPDGSLRKMTWGFKRQMKGKTGKPISRTIVNSREDKLSSHTWREAFHERRCLIPAFSFYEWIERPGGMVPLNFESSANQLLWIAGIWEEDQNRGHVYSMITTEPNALVAPVHDRMPAVLLPDQMLPFLQGDMNEFGPSAVQLKFSDAANFLQPKKQPPAQGELY
jgi:putative SOS response-associated peptidase YedK